MINYPNLHLVWVLEQMVLEAQDYFFWFHLWLWTGNEAKLLYRRIIPLWYHLQTDGCNLQWLHMQQYMSGSKKSWSIGEKHTHVYTWNIRPQQTVSLSQVVHYIIVHLLKTKLSSYENARNHKCLESMSDNSNLGTKSWLDALCT